MTDQWNLEYEIEEDNFIKFIIIFNDEPFANITYSLKNYVLEDDIDSIYDFLDQPNDQTHTMYFDCYSSYTDSKKLTLSKTSVDFLFTQDYCGSDDSFQIKLPFNKNIHQTIKKVFSRIKEIYDR